MEPKLPMPSNSPEMGNYQRREAPAIAPEQQKRPNMEALSNAAEKHEVQPQGPTEPIVIPAVPAQPFLPTPDPAAPVVAATPVNDANPAMANDDDLIEKEWVDKAKKIIRDTKDDPYTQEREVSRLQADYIKKRYGKDVKIASD